MRIRDLLAEAWAGPRTRPVRTMLASGGTVLGSAALIATLGLTTTVRSNVTEAFDAYAATEVVLERAAPDTPLVPRTERVQRLGQLPEVQASGDLWEVDTGNAGTRARWAATAVDGPLYAASSDSKDVLLPHMTSGTWFTSTIEDRADRVAVVSEPLARDLQLAPVSRRPSVFVDGTALTVIGTYDNVQRHPEVLRGLIVPTTTARDVWGDAPRGTPIVAIATVPGAAPVIARQAALALAPTAPTAYVARPVLDARHLRGQVDQGIAQLFIALAAVALLVGMLSAANTTMISVIQRTGEIGLRRALGASRREVGLQFLAESAAVGVAGGLIGSSLGTIIVVVGANSRGLVPTMDLRLTAIGPAVGLLAGIIAGAYPAMRASRVDPADALRSS
ncbi:MAG TPA: ABC transporter permease [Acidimicrobiales bacterium]|jgi:putative ABC transport system permease protein|nr:ABC transporter permease [Acidimicrobiales bacterium]